MSDATVATVAELLTGLPLNLEDPELQQTPERVADLWHNHLLCGDGDAKKALGTLIPAPSQSIVTVLDLPFQCICPHHLTPTFGHVHLAFEPGDWIVGLGALPDMVHALSRRAILQETLTEALATALMEHVGARGAACSIEAQHLCMSLRGRAPHDSRVGTHVTKGTLEGRTGLFPEPAPRR